MCARFEQSKLKLTLKKKDIDFFLSLLFFIFIESKNYKFFSSKFMPGLLAAISILPQNVAIQAATSDIRLSNL